MEGYSEARMANLREAARAKFGPLAGVGRLEGWVTEWNGCWGIVASNAFHGRLGTHIKLLLKDSVMPFEGAKCSFVVTLPPKLKIPDAWKLWIEQ